MGKNFGVETNARPGERVCRRKRKAAHASDVAEGLITLDGVDEV